MEICLNASAKADQFTIFFQHLKTFCDHINISFGKDRMFIQSMDSAHVCVVDLNLPSTWFDYYSNNSEDTLQVGVSSTLLFKILNLRDKSQQIKINYEYQGDKTDHLYVEFTTKEGETLKEFDKHFEIPLMDVDCDMLDIPAISHNAELSMKSAHYASLINQLKQFGDTLNITCSDSKIVLEAHSVEQCKMNVDIKIDDLNMFTIDEGINDDSPLNISFSLNYLYMICLYNKLSDLVHIKMSDAYPLKVVYFLDGVDEEEGVELDTKKVANVSLYLAPKIDDD